MADTKNWTWVLERTCPECGFTASQLAREDIGPTTANLADEYLALLDAGTGDTITGNAADRFRRRPAVETWSAFEYCCHVRDVFRVMGERLTLMLAEDDPTFANWDQDATAVDDGYDTLDAARVRADLHAHADRLATGFGAVTVDQWNRRGMRSDGAAFTVASLGRYMVHDVNHHLWDIEQGYASVDRS